MSEKLSSVQCSVYNFADMFFIRARMGPFHPRADGTRSHPRADGAPGAIRAALRTLAAHDARARYVLGGIAYDRVQH